MATVLLSSVESCEGGHGLCHHLLEKRRSALASPKKQRVMTLVFFLLSSIESCGCGDGICSKEGEVCPSTPKKERSMPMAIVLLFLNRELWRWPWHTF